jgi:hypothetical protein
LQVLLAQAVDIGMCPFSLASGTRIAETRPRHNRISESGCYLRVLANRRENEPELDLLASETQRTHYRRQRLLTRARRHSGSRDDFGRRVHRRRAYQEVLDKTISR